MSLIGPSATQPFSLRKWTRMELLIVLISFAGGASVCRNRFSSISLPFVIPKADGCETPFPAVFPLFPPFGGANRIALPFFPPTPLCFAVRFRFLHLLWRFPDVFAVGFRPTRTDSEGGLFFRCFFPSPRCAGLNVPGGVRMRWLLHFFFSLLRPLSGLSWRCWSACSVSRSPGSRVFFDLRTNLILCFPPWAFFPCQVVGIVWF